MTLIFPHYFFLLVYFPYEPDVPTAMYIVQGSFNNYVDNIWGVKKYLLLSTQGGGGQK